MVGSCCRRPHQAFGRRLELNEPGMRHAPSLRLSARRDQELQDLVDKRRIREGKEQQEKERQLRLRQETSGESTMFHAFELLFESF